MTRGLDLHRETLAQVSGLLHGSSAITNAAGVPGTGGFVGILRRTGEPVLLTGYHVLFARGRKAGDPVWSVDRGTACSPQMIGRTLNGKAGNVLGMEPPTFVDCATVRLSEDASALLGPPAPLQVAQARPGEAVSKHGAATGTTQGVVVDISYPDHWHWEYRSVSAPNQILIRSMDGRPFSHSGDSGAVIRNAGGQVVGQLWGTTACGEGVASPIQAVARALGLVIAETPGVAL